MVTTYNPPIFFSCFLFIFETRSDSLCRLGRTKTHNVSKTGPKFTMMLLSQFITGMYHNAQLLDHISHSHLKTILYNHII